MCCIYSSILIYNTVIHLVHRCYIYLRQVVFVFTVNDFFFFFYFWLIHVCLLMVMHTVRPLLFMGITKYFLFNVIQLFMDAYLLITYIYIYIYIFMSLL